MTNPNMLGFGRGGSSGGDVSAKTASAATAYAMILQAINTASVDGGYKIAEVQGVFAELAPLLDPALSDISSAKISEAFDNATDANSLASSSVFRDLVNAGGYIDELGRASAELSQHYGGYDIANLEYVKNSDGIAGIYGNPQLGPVFSGDRLAVYFGVAQYVIRQTLSVAGDVRSTYGTPQYLNIQTVGGQNSILGLDVAPDESRILVTDNTLDDIFEYDIATPGDLSTATVNSNQSAGNVPRCPAYAPDGMAVYYVNNSSSQLVRFPLSTAYDFSTRGPASFGSLPTAPAGLSWPQVRGVSIRDGGNYAYMAFQNSTLLHAYSLSGASLTYEHPNNIALASIEPTQTNVGGGVWISDDDLKNVYVGDGADLWQYKTPPTELQAPA
ncbi:beta-propeller fold lactonase family protein [Oceanicaulis sp.]|uniref:beta-propeller fold lactonase family protein n=1 Tax=Oceanicaulis sp. TaxID=1924941 RepID=UPI003F727809